MRGVVLRGVMGGPIPPKPFTGPDRPTATWREGDGPDRGDFKGTLLKRPPKIYVT